MTKILYGVHGTGHGHAIRALAVARHYAGHDFRFVAHGDAAELLRREFPVEECPNPETPVRFHRVATATAVRRNLSVWRRKAELLRTIEELVDRFEPDVAMTDYEFFLPLVCRNRGVPCLSLDHQHIVTACPHRPPFLQLPSYFATHWAIRNLFSQASHFLVTSFFRPRPYSSYRTTRIVPPLLRRTVLDNEPTDGDHVIAYQGYSTFKRFLPFLRSIRRPVKVYGFSTERTEGNLHFRKNSERIFLKDLASCCYIICGGGHTLLSEALFYGKPVMSFPIENAFEQFLNAFYIEKLGYGRKVAGFDPKSDLIGSFEARLDWFRKNIREANFNGNAEIFSLLDRFVSERNLLSDFKFTALGQTGRRPAAPLDSGLRSLMST
jgi:uncharacterized protein (TIGR00661 family)